ncbi:hypothetical protein DY000_02004950 [Brassica cretica]|uniref:Uncharacterized protein n=1 Tax=Brassica cretica TaxID=69181 RepID=A0ABQ7CGX3_BRACR|nr:hypothetical protein DY000_02004950 [Brassica cretica]
MADERDGDGGDERRFQKECGGEASIDRISIDTLIETSTDYSIGISIDALGQALMRRLNMLSKLTRSALAYSSKFQLS